MRAPRLAWACLAAAAVGPGARAGAAPPWTELPAGRAALAPVELAELVAHAREAVAAVQAEGLAAAPGGEGLGSGFFIRADGLLVTNAHVVEGARRVWLQLDRGRRVPARVLGLDARTDLALLKAELGRPAPVLPLGDSDRLRVGAWLVAIGHPWGLQPVVSQGVLGGVGRAIGDLERFRAGFFDFLQTDAAIERGNSGGPLLNLRGEVVGITTATNARARGIGFAIPVNVARAVLPQLLAAGRVARVQVGVGVDDLTWEVASSLGLVDTRGAIVTRVRPDSPAARAGLRPGDVLRAFEGHALRGRSDLTWRVATWPAGVLLRLGVWREGQALELRLAPEPRTSPAEDGGAPGPAPPEGPVELGLEVQDLPAAVARAAGLGPAAGGVLVLRADGEAGLGGLRPGDVLLELDGQPILGGGELRARLERAPAGAMLRFYLLRQQAARYLAFPKRWRVGD